MMASNWGQISSEVDPLRVMSFVLVDGWRA